MIEHTRITYCDIDLSKAESVTLLDKDGNPCEDECPYFTILVNTVVHCSLNHLEQYYTIKVELCDSKWSGLIATFKNPCYLTLALPPTRETVLPFPTHYVAIFGDERGAHRIYRYNLSTSIQDCVNTVNISELKHNLIISLSQTDDVNTANQLFDILDRHHKMFTSLHTESYKRLAIKTLIQVLLEYLEYLNEGIKLEYFQPNKRVDVQDFLDTCKVLENYQID